MAANNDLPHRTVGLATVGHGTRTFGELLDVLAAAAVQRVVDVRSYPQSRRFPWFGRQRLDANLERAGIAYVWMGRELGGKRRVTPDTAAQHPALDRGMAAFASHMASPAFARAARNVRAMTGGSDGSVALLCAERDPAQCHRGLVADYMQMVEDVAVVHWLAPGHSRLHENDPAVRIGNDGTLCYDGGYTLSLWTSA